MSSPYQITAGDFLYTVVNDCTTSYLALVTGAVTDEILGELYAPDFTVDTERSDLAFQNDSERTVCDHGLSGPILPPSRYDELSVI